MKTVLFDQYRFQLENAGVDEEQIKLILPIMAALALDTMINKDLYYEVRHVFDSEERKKNHKVCQELRETVEQWKPRTISETCGECGHLYQMTVHDLDLQIGDRVIRKINVGGEMAKYPITITDVSNKDRGLYFGTQPSMVLEGTEKTIRVDTRHKEYVKV